MAKSHPSSAECLLPLGFTHHKAQGEGHHKTRLKNLINHV